VLSVKDPEDYFTLKNSKPYRFAKYIVYKQTILRPIDHLWTFLGALIGISLIGVTQQSQLLVMDTVFLVGSFGASAVLIYGATNSPLAQPRNLFGGHLIGALIGVTIALLFPQENLLWFSSGLAVALSIVAMQITRTVHPPGGATALIAIIGSEEVKSLGYKYVFSPILVSVLIMFFVALVFNNIPDDRCYPYNLKKDE
jgi:CBS-domain-containing membrane protein